MFYDIVQSFILSDDMFNNGNEEMNQRLDDLAEKGDYDIRGDFAMIYLVWLFTSMHIRFGTDESVKLIYAALEGTTEAITTQLNYYVDVKDKFEKIRPQIRELSSLIVDLDGK
jgi:hypothetical protein